MTPTSPSSTTYTTYTRSPASSFGFSRRESSATEASASGASSYSVYHPTESASGANGLLQAASSLLKAESFGHREGLSSPPQLQQLRPLKLPARVAEQHQRQQSTIQPFMLQERKASLPAITWAGAPSTPIRRPSDSTSPRALHKFTSTPSLRSRLPALGNGTLARFGSSSNQSQGHGQARHRIASGSSLPTRSVRQPLSGLDTLEVVQTLPLRHTKGSMPSRATVAVPRSPNISRVPTLNKLRGFRSSPTLRPDGQLEASPSRPNDSYQGLTSPRSSVLSTLHETGGGGGERRSMLPLSRPPRTSSNSSRVEGR